MFIIFIFDALQQNKIPIECEITDNRNFNNCLNNNDCFL